MNNETVLQGCSKHTERESSNTDISALYLPNSNLKICPGFLEEQPQVLYTPPDVRRGSRMILNGEEWYSVSAGAGA